MLHLQDDATRGRDNEDDEDSSDGAIDDFRRPKRQRKIPAWLKAGEYDATINTSLTGKVRGKGIASRGQACKDSAGRGQVSKGQTAGTVQRGGGLSSRVNAGRGQGNKGLACKGNTGSLKAASSGATGIGKGGHDRGRQGQPGKGPVGEDPSCSRLALATRKVSNI